MNERVVITGIGCVSCFGIGHRAFMAAIGIGQAAASRRSPGSIRPVAIPTVRPPSTDSIPLRSSPRSSFGASMLSGASLLRAPACCSRMPARRRRPNMTTSASRSARITAGLDSLVEYLGGLSDHGPTGVPAILFSNTVSNAPASLCAIEFGLHGPNVTFNQREASSLERHLVQRWRDSRRPHRCHDHRRRRLDRRNFFKVHDRFRSMSPMRRFDPADEGARPFDRGRNGFTMGEGGFLVLLESASAAAARGARVYGEILGVGAAASSTSINGWPTDASGIARTMRLALSDAAACPGRCRCGDGAANGSPLLDRLEAEAIGEVFETRQVAVASVKGAVGESGAAGAAGLIAGLLSLAGGGVPPTAGSCRRIRPVRSASSSRRSRRRARCSSSTASRAAGRTTAWRSGRRPSALASALRYHQRTCAGLKSTRSAELWHGRLDSHRPSGRRDRRLPWHWARHRRGARARGAPRSRFAIANARTPRWKRPRSSGAEGVTALAGQCDVVRRSVGRGSFSVACVPSSDRSTSWSTTPASSATAS